MDKFPSNSNRSKEPDEPKEKVNGPVISGAVKRKKKPLGRKFKEAFIGGPDTKTVWNYVFMDVLIPAAKDVTIDAVTQGLERLIYGESIIPNRRPRSASSSGNTVVNYNRMSQPARPALESRARSFSTQSISLDDLVLETRYEADRVLNGMAELIERYGQASVNDLGELVGLTGEYTDEHWGWTDLTGSRISRSREGYLLVLPSPQSLK